MYNVDPEVHGHDLTEEEDDVEVLHPAASKGSVAAVDEEAQLSKGRAVAARERFAYWCFDLLFLICSDVQKGMPFLFQW